MHIDEELIQELRGRVDQP